MTDKIDLVKQACLREKGKNPVEIALKLMSLPGISVHGPEHHIIDGAAFLTAMHNAGAEFNLPEALNELEARGRRMPGAICGQWGICGASASVGAALSIVHGTGPLSDCEYYKDNLKLTSSVLAGIAEVGGPRCCKRNAFISLKRAVEFVNKKYGYDLEDVETACSFSRLNPQCIRERCPFYKSSQRPG